MLVDGRFAIVTGLAATLVVAGIAQATDDAGSPVIPPALAQETTTTTQSTMATSSAPARGGSDGSSALSSPFTPVYLVMMALVGVAWENAVRAKARERDMTAWLTGMIDEQLR